MRDAYRQLHRVILVTASLVAQAILPAYAADLCTGNTPSKCGGFPCVWSRSEEKCDIDPELAGFTGPDLSSETARKIQDQLNKKGIKVPLRRKNDKATRGAIETFQKREGLKVDGILGPKTLGKLYSPAG
jgi:hypothetical protein